VAFSEYMNFNIPILVKHQRQEFILLEHLSWQ
jgi:hypothetical protein